MGMEEINPPVYNKMRYLMKEWDNGLISIRLGLWHDQKRNVKYTS